MSRTLEEIEADLTLLAPRDFNLSNIEANGMERLYKLVEELVSVGEPERTKEVLFLTIERLSRTEDIDPRFDLGTPGPIIHALEKLPDYGQQLKESVQRYPTPLTVWMINRTLNAVTNEEDKKYWLAVLREILKHPLATVIVKEDVQDFLEHQENRNNTVVPLE